MDWLHGYTVSFIQQELTIGEASALCLMSERAHAGPKQNSQSSVHTRHDWCIYIQQRCRYTLKVVAVVPTERFMKQDSASLRP